MPVKLEEGIDLTFVGMAQGTDITESFIVHVERPVISYPASLDTGLIAFWDFNEGRGNTLKDKVGTNHGTLYGGTTWRPGRRGSGLYFDGVDDYVVCGSSLSIGTGPFTISAWIKLADGAPLDSDTNIYNIVFKGNTSPAFFAFNLRGGMYNGLIFTIYDGSNSRAIYPSSQNLSNIIKDYKFHHVLITRNSSGNAYLFFDGNVVATATNYTYNPDSGYNLAIGVRYIGNNPIADWFKGIIDEIRIYNRYLDADEVKLLYQLGRQKLELGDDPTNMSLQP